MISVPKLLHTTSALASKNAPALLTAFGAIGVATTAVLTAKASFEAAKKIADAEYEHNINRRAHEDEAEFTTMEKAKIVWPCYIPAVFAGATTIGAVILSHRVSSKRAAIIAAAYAMNEAKIEEYQAKVKEKFGVGKEKTMRDEIQQDRIEKDFKEGEILFHPTDGKVIIKDGYSGRYFWSTIEEINKTVNEINLDIVMDGSKTLTDFYKGIGIEAVATSDYVGWNTRERCEVDWTTGTTPDKTKAVHVFNFVNEPVLNPGANASF